MFYENHKITNAEYCSDVIDFVTTAEDSIDLDKIQSASLEEVSSILIDIGIFKDIDSIKLYLATKPLRDIYNEEECYPIHYHKTKDEDEDFSEYDELANKKEYNLASGNFAVDTTL